MKHSIALAISLAALAPGCKEKAKPPPAGSTAPAADAATAAPTPEPAKPLAFLPAKLAEKLGVLFAAAQGGTIEGKSASGAIEKLKDGTVVEVGEIVEPDMSSGDTPPTAQVTVGGKTYTVRTHEVLTEANLARSPDGTAAIFSVVTSCGDLCHTDAWLVTSAGKRASLGEGGVDTVTAWRKDGKEVAIGSSGLVIVALPDLTVRTLDDYTAPAYGPDGTLYVRDHDGSAFTLGANDKATRVWKAPKQPAADSDEGEEGEYGGDAPTPVTFDPAGKPKYALE
ncbi:MAG TPA: hypothetical protein VM261_08770 [Kofleriaceae bacterium]|nr:hypothetical protein [Kofleriaceae bacterium]